MTDKVEDLLRNLKEGKDFTKEQLHEAITYHHSFVTEKESLRNACSFQEKETSNITDQLRKELAQLKADAKDEKAKSCEGYEKSESKVQGQPKALEKLRQENAQLNAEKLKLIEQIDELRNRLSVIAGHKLTNQNPEIADLSDAFRPTKIAEQFRELYDNEWTCAFEEIAIKFEHEEEIIDFLASVIKDTDHFCIRAGLQQLEHLKFFTKSVLKDPEYQPEGKKESEIKPLKCGYPARMSKSQEELADKLLKDFRKSLGIISNTPLMMIYRQVSSLIKDKIESIESSPLKELDKFLTKAFQLIWVMKTQDPVMEFVWCKPGNKFDKNMYTHYTKRGSTVTQCIWPAVVLHKDGPLMSKGVVQGN